MNSYKKFLNQFSTYDADVLFNEPLKNHTSFKIGGNARAFIIVKNVKTLKAILDHSQNSFIIGAGTNILFGDKPIKKYIIKLGGDFCNITKIRETASHVILKVGAGVNLFTLNKFCLDNNLHGLEWSYGIPGTIGGATAMNAGAFDHEIQNVITSVRFLSNGNVRITKSPSFSYRDSQFQHDKSVILSVNIKLEKSNIDVYSLQQRYINARKETQPYGAFCAGSIFKRIINENTIIYPAKIIDNLGLKGVKIKEAEVSTKHAGFIINNGTAKSADVKRLIKLIKAKTKKETGIDLIEEIIIL